MKGIILCYIDVDPGATANLLVLRASVVFAGTDVPGGAQSTLGEFGNGVPVNIDITALNQYANNCEDSLIAEASRLALPVLARNDCLFPAYTRGA
jgi:hypothetical protein